MIETIVLKPKVNSYEKGANTDFKNSHLPQETRDAILKVSEKLSEHYKLMIEISKEVAEFAERLTETIEIVYEFSDAIRQMLKSLEETYIPLYGELNIFQPAQTVYNPSIFNDPGPLPSYDDFEICDKFESDNGCSSRHNFISKIMSYFNYLLPFYTYLVHIKDVYEVIFFFLPLLGITPINEQPSQIINLNIDVHIHINNSESWKDDDTNVINEFINEALLQEL